MFKIYVLEGNKVGLHCLSFVIMSFMETKFLSVILSVIHKDYWYITDIIIWIHWTNISMKASSILAEDGYLYWYIESILI